MKRGIFLDRDGVINKPIIRKGIPHSPTHLSDLVIFPEAKTAITQLIGMSFEIVVITNQPDIARGKISTNTVRKMNQEISRSTLIKHFRVCPHDDIDKCYCRKPLPGLILAAALELDIDIKESYLIGDRWRDIEAGNSVGCKSFFIDYGYKERKPRGDYTIVNSISEAVNIIRRLDAV